MIKIDFHGSTHGHFLEYVANVYIMQTAPSKTNIFKAPTYSAHNPDNYYHSDKIITCGHYSNPNYNLTINDDDIIIRINLDITNCGMFYIALTNLIFKAGDVGFEKQLLSVPDYIRNNAVSHRNDWYSKLKDRDIYAAHYYKFPQISNDIVNFSFEAFFSFNSFCKELDKLAQYLNQTFFPDQSLYDLWAEFIKVNQGWQSYIKCDQILEFIFSNNYKEIDCNIIEQGWINYNLSQMCRLYDGQLFENNTYPTDTQTIYNMVQNHLTNLR
jgi:hypothetical protein